MISMYSELTECKKPKGYIKTRGLHCWDLLDGNKFKTSNRGGKGAHNRAFKLDIRWLAMRKQGMGLRSIELKTGVNKNFIGNAFRSLYLDPIHKGGNKRKSAQGIYEDEWMKEIESVKKDKTWARHPEVAKHVARKKYYTDPKSHNMKCEEWRLRNREKVREARKKWKPGYFKRNPSAKIADTLRSRMLKAINAQQAGKKASAVQDLGCSIEFFMQYIEARFKDGMTWGNHGLYGWHFDHIKPCASFDLTKKSEQKKCFHYTNYQPLWAEDNLVKSDKQDEQLNLL